MDAPNKRVLTDEAREAVLASDQFSRSSSAGTPDDLLQRLRNVGARGRKSVLEGYRTTPSSFSKAQSTGSIFKSMNDTLHEVYHNDDNTQAESTNNHSNTSRKRSRSVTDRDDRDYIPDEPTEDNVAHNTVSSRSIKPLKSRTGRRPLLETHSLPAGAFSFGSVNHSSEVKYVNGMVGEVVLVEAEEEEDWSQENTFQLHEQSFEPMIL